MHANNWAIMLNGATATEFQILKLIFKKFRKGENLEMNKK